MSVKHTFIGPNGDITKSLTAMSAIKEFCRQCMGWCEGVDNQVTACTSSKCALFPYRKGRNPEGVYSISDADKARRVANLQKSR